MIITIDGKPHFNLPDEWTKAQMDEYISSNPIRRLVMLKQPPSSPRSRLNARDRHHLGVQLGREITTKADLQRGLDETGLGFRDNMDHGKQPKQTHEQRYAAATAAADEQLSQ